jgi:hypothetical protein
MTYTGVLSTIFTGIEPSIALSLACVPFLRPLIKSNKMSTRADSQYEYGRSSTLRSKGPAYSGNGHFKELNDDSSEVQLRPMGRSDSMKYETEIGQGQQRPAEPAGVIYVKKGWDVVSSETGPGSR